METLTLNQPVSSLHLPDTLTFIDPKTNHQCNAQIIQNIHPEQTYSRYFLYSRMNEYVYYSYSGYFDVSHITGEILSTWQCNSIFPSAIKQFQKLLRMDNET